MLFLLRSMASPPRAQAREASQRPIRGLPARSFRAQDARVRRVPRGRVRAAAPRKPVWSVSPPAARR